jgi:UDPglucose--hexose-1-phosphate uridylyltransferase
VAVIAPGRAKRPGAARSSPDPPTPGELESCPFCVGHEDMTPPQALVLPEKGPWSVRVVPNLYPAFERHEVVVHSPRHVRSIAQLSTGEIDLVAEAWRRRAEAVSGNVFALLNEGRDAGASLPHSHSQLVWLPDELMPASKARPRGAPFLEDGGLIAVCPWASRVPYECVIQPAEPERDALSSPLLSPALHLLAELVRRVHALEGVIALNAWLEHDADDWRIVLLPRLTVLAALELGAGVFIDTLSPDEAARRLQAL